MRAFRLAYDGRPFHGFQRQPDVPTVEGVLLDALADLDLLATDADVPAGYAAAGRTDAGVSAVAQTVAFEAPDWCTPRALNGELIEAVRAWASADMPADFHATRDAARREYTYVMPGVGTDREAARAAAARLAGEHDFHNLTPDAHGTVRDLEVTVESDGDFLQLVVTSDGFPRQLVRRLASVVRVVSTGERPLGYVDRVLSPDPLDGPAGVPPAPAEGLVLSAVDYPDGSFAIDEAALADARAGFKDRTWTARTEARAMERITGGLDGA